MSEIFEAKIGKNGLIEIKGENDDDISLAEKIREKHQWSETMRKEEPTDESAKQEKSGIPPKDDKTVAMGNINDKSSNVKADHEQKSDASKEAAS